MHGMWRSFTRLMESRDPQLAAISAKAIKEARYHLRFSRGWLERLGNGTDVSGQKDAAGHRQVVAFLLPNCSMPTRLILH